MKHSWEEIDEYRGILFPGKWPTILEMFMISLQQFPGNKCFTVFTPDRNTMTYTEVYDECSRIGSYLQQQGLKKGDKVVINGKNSPQWALAYLSVFYAGGIVVPLDNQMHPDRVGTLSAFCEASFFFGDSSVIDALSLDAPWVNNLKGVATLLGRSKHCPTLEELKPTKLYPSVPSSCEDDAAILFTSGTTGNEKGAVLSHANIISDVYQACDGIFLELDDRDVLYALLPLHHSYCCTSVLLESIRHGSECVFGHEIAVSKMIVDLTRGNVTIFMGIPLLYNKVLSGMMKQVKKKGVFVNSLVHTMMFINGIMKKYLHLNPFRKTFNKLLLNKIGLDHNRICICGAGPLSPKVFKQYQQLGLDFIQGYGLTETSPILTLNPISHFKIESVGMCFPLVDMKIGNPDEKGIGEILVKGPNVTRGYYKDKAHTKELFTEDGYLKTGDLGCLDKENYLYLKGRAKNLIVTEGGKNVYPEEIEDLFQLYTQVEQVLIRGYQEKKDVPAECIEAVIYPNMDFFKESKEDPQKNLEAVIKEVNQNLSGYKKITKLTLIDKPMAMTSTQKIKRGKVIA
ncbi:AMP-forming long-chain acyl-CoA synthetase [Sphaerochaeta pleomorpha str. Grapes]|uniref:AMP-forming long-chain acyl-CoA synthetase n=1 Tax=Sphaerochaeta pleomorpha (strain ATCC BAA-1885 / DSM 22778 / Grapes) TaxID=158190 RepID=G8QYB6_SPHPG|nr:AMP-binding protein [Sphaerochaeta pleomorpha]AEV30763.1 AMP-forming long-chain acyl-CoA synthetase [Sphaerochaeta pleomorpha str. Grapes]